MSNWPSIFILLFMVFIPFSAKSNIWESSWNVQSECQEECVLLDLGHLSPYRYSVIFDRREVWIYGRMWYERRHFVGPYLTYRLVPERSSPDPPVFLETF